MRYLLTFILCIFAGNAFANQSLMQIVGSAVVESEGSYTVYWDIDSATVNTGQTLTGSYNLIASGGVDNSGYIESDAYGEYGEIALATDDLDESSGRIELYMRTPDNTDNTYIIETPGMNIQLLGGSNIRAVWGANYMSSTDTVSNNTWTKIVVTWDDAADEMSITVAGGTPTTSTETDPAPGNQTYLRVGGGSGTPNIEVDEIYVYTTTE